MYIHGDGWIIVLIDELDRPLASASNIINDLWGHQNCSEKGTRQNTTKTKKIQRSSEPPSPLTCILRSVNCHKRQRCGAPHVFLNLAIGQPLCCRPSPHCCSSTLSGCRPACSMLPLRFGLYAFGDPTDRRRPHQQGHLFPTIMASTRQTLRPCATARCLFLFPHRPADDI